MRVLGVDDELRRVLAVLRVQQAEGVWPGAREQVVAEDLASDVPCVLARRKRTPKQPARPRRRVREEGDRSEDRQRESAADRRKCGWGDAAWHERVPRERFALRLALMDAQRQPCARDRNRDGAGGANPARTGKREEDRPSADEQSGEAGRTLPARFAGARAEREKRQDQRQEHRQHVRVIAHIMDARHGGGEDVVRAQSFDAAGQPKIIDIVAPDDPQRIERQREAGGHERPSQLASAEQRQIGERVERDDGDAELERRFEADTPVD